MGRVETYIALYTICKRIIKISTTGVTAAAAAAVVGIKGRRARTQRRRRRRTSESESACVYSIPTIFSRRETREGKKKTTAGIEKLFGILFFFFFFVVYVIFFFPPDDWRYTEKSGGVRTAKRDARDRREKNVTILLPWLNKLIMYSNDY